MDPNRLLNLLPRRRRADQRGSLIVTVFVVVMGLTLVLGGVNALLKAQMANSLEIKTMAMGRLQAMYLAEMGVNRFMQEANALSLLPAVPITYDFKENVAMTRSPNAGVARCTIEATAPGVFRVTPTLQTADGPFDIPWIITFVPTFDNTDNLFVLARYEVTKKP